MNAQTKDVTMELQLAEDAKRVPMTLEPMTPNQLVQIAVQNRESLDYVRELMQLEREWKADRAKEAFFAALAEFKKVPVNVTKDKENKQYKSFYTSLGNMVNTVNAAMAPFGLNANWEIEQNGEDIRVTCVLSHTLGHSIRVGLSAPPDESGNKNDLQKIKSTITYLEGATFQAVTGVVSNDKNLNPDDDGNDAAGRISVDQQTVINDKLAEVEEAKAGFLNWLKVDAVEKIRAKDYDRAIALLDKKIAAKQKQ